MPPLLRTQSLGVRYLSRRAHAVQGVSFSVQPGERLLLGGPSGSGKSTLGLCLSGLIPLSIDADISGSVEVDGRLTVAYPQGQLAERVGVVFQDPSSEFTMLTVEDEVAFGLENLGVPSPEMPARVFGALEAVGLSERADWRIDRLSGGQQQRVALAAALAMRPQALVLDEPTAHLDPCSATQLYATIRAVADASATTLVLVEHDVDRLVRHAKRGLLLDPAGRLVLDAPLEQVFHDPAQARLWQSQGVRLPTPTAVAVALEEEPAHRPDSDEPASALVRSHGSDMSASIAPPGLSPGGLPVSADEFIVWLAQRPAAQLAFRNITGRSRSVRALGDTVIRARGVWSRYRGVTSDYLALRDVDLSVAEGELVAVVGANGSGKSTLLRTLGGLLRPERGDVQVAGVGIHLAPARQVASLVSHVFQNPEAGFVADTVEAELAYGPRALGWTLADIKDHTQNLMQRFELTALARANPFSLSEGQKRRLSVATSLMLGPRALLLDEPTFGQDRVSAAALMAEIASLCDRGLAVVVATHDLSLVTGTADRVVALEGGQVVFDGPPQALVANSRLLESIGQEPPALDQLLASVRQAGFA